MSASFSSSRPASSSSTLQSFTLSRTHNPNFKQLLQILDPANSKGPITFVIGAGTSIDAGLPSWEELIRRVTTKIKNDNSRNLALSDEADGLLRKTEYVLELVLSERGRGTPEELVRDALYGNTKETVPGQAANALAALVVDAWPRIRLATTNFDDVLETALGRTISKQHIKAFTLEQVDEWKKSKSPSVLHLHGILDRGTPRGKIILSESSFLKYGPEARSALKTCLEEGPVVFIGLSLTDPNLVGPLWDTRKETKSGEATRVQPCFALHVPPVLKQATELAQGAADEAYEAIDISRAYGVAKYSYVEKKLGLKPIYLKSYGQMTQALIEMRLAHMNPSAYLRGRSPKTCPAYGHRLGRLLDSAYGSLGCTQGFDAPTPEDAFEFNRKLRAALEPDSVLGSLLKGFQKTQKKQVQDLINAHGSAGYPMDPPLDQEHFALFVWLRSRETAPHDARYAINLIGSSSIAHGDPYALRQNEPISPLSQYVIAKSVFAGNAIRTNLEVRQNPAAWRGILCCPVRAWEAHEKTAKSGPTSWVTVGGISLNSSHYIRPQKIKSKIVPVSVLGTLDQWQMADLQGELETVARTALGLVAKL